MDQNWTLHKCLEFQSLPIFHHFSSCVLNFTLVFSTTKILSCWEEWFSSGGFTEVGTAASVSPSIHLQLVEMMEHVWKCCGIFWHAVSGIQRPLILPTSQPDVPQTWCQRVVRFRRHVGGSIPGQGIIKWQSSSKPALWYLQNVRCSLFDPLFTDLTRFQTRKSFRNQVYALCEHLCLYRVWQWANLKNWTPTDVG